MAKPTDPIVVRNERGEVVVVTQEHREEAKRRLAEIDAHNQRIERLQQSRNAEDLDSASKDAIRRVVKDPVHFIIGGNK